eukprot:1385089-Rhodomonas_salina.3
MGAGAAWTCIVDGLQSVLVLRVQIRAETLHVHIHHHHHHRQCVAVSEESQHCFSFVSLSSVRANAGFVDSELMKHKCGMSFLSLGPVLIIVTMQRCRDRCHESLTIFSIVIDPCCSNRQLPNREKEQQYRSHQQSPFIISIASAIT